VGFGRCSSPKSPEQQQEGLEVVKTRELDQNEGRRLQMPLKIVVKTKICDSMLSYVEDAVVESPGQDSRSHNSRHPGNGMDD
jgi:hypothetical protein